MTPDSIPPPFLERVAVVESSNNPAAVAKGSSAAGLYQFTIGTWLGLMKKHPELKLTVDGRMSREQSTRAMKVFTAENAAIVERAIGRPLTFSEMYLAHFAGPAGAIRVLRADPGCPVRDALGAQACEANPPLATMTCADLRAWARRKVPDALPVSIATPARKLGKAGAPTEADRLNDAQLAKLRKE